MNGIIFFEDGSTQVIGNLTTVRNIAAAINNILPNLLKQEREALLQSISKEEMKQIVERFAQEAREPE